MSVNFSIKCLKVSTALVFVLFFQYSLAQVDSALVERFLKNNKDDLGKQFSLVVAKGGKILYVKNSGEEFNLNTQAPIAHISKWLTSAMIMSLVDEGKINLDDRISRYIPIFEKYRKSYITLRQCLTHQTGLEQGKTPIAKSFENLEEACNYLASKVEIDYTPGEFFYFGDAGLYIAARVCEVVTKKQFDQLISDKITKPLQMRSTNFGDGSKGPNPSYSAVSTVKDFTNFLTMIANKGLFNGKKVLSENAINEMNKLQIDLSKVKYTPEGTKGIGLGFGPWLLETNEASNGIVLGAQGFLANWCYVDLCRGYSCVLFVDKLSATKKTNLIDQLKTTFEDSFPSTCKS
jgi:CubicO group peptidase (beta-lactamase class C family)